MNQKYKIWYTENTDFMCEMYNCCNNSNIKVIAINKKRENPTIIYICSVKCKKSIFGNLHIKEYNKHKSNIMYDKAIYEHCSYFADNCFKYNYKKK
jgi:hypothetical protein